MSNYIVQSLIDMSESVPDTPEPRPAPVQLANGDNVTRIVFKDEGRDEEGHSLGRSYAENSQGGVAISYGWTTWKDAERLATAFGVDLQEV